MHEIQESKMLLNRGGLAWYEQSFDERHFLFVKGIWMVCPQFSLLR
jgi:hypothetical protein